jgi:hypothetical protein
MRQQTGLRGCQIYGVAGRPIKQIAAWIEAKSGEAEIVGRSARHRPAATSDPHDPLDRLVQADDVDRCGNTIRCAGNAVILHLWLFRTAHTTSIGTSVRRLTIRIVLVPAAGARLKSRTITSGLLRLIKSKNGFGPSPADRVRASRLLHLPVSINLHAQTIWS